MSCQREAIEQLTSSKKNKKVLDKEKSF